MQSRANNCGCGTESTSTAATAKRHGETPGRGVAYWTDGKEARIFVITTGFYLVALEAKTGPSR
jgi:hypothetical protein